MRIPDDITGCVVFLCIETNNPGYQKFHYGGTGFLVIRPSESIPELSYGYLVTAKHCLERATKPLYIRINLQNGGCEFIKLEAEWECGEGETDVAVLQFFPDLTRHALRALPFEMLATDKMVSEESIGIGDDLIITGLFSSRRGEKRNIPILRFGNIAAMPDEPLESETGQSYSAYLAEVRSIGGLSGSPVFVHLSPDRTVWGRATSKTMTAGLDPLDTPRD